MINIKLENFRLGDEKHVATLIARLLDSQGFDVQITNDNIKHFWKTEFADKLNLIAIQQETTISIGMQE